MYVLLLLLLLSWAFDTFTFFVLSGIGGVGVGGCNITVSMRGGQVSRKRVGVASM